MACALTRYRHTDIAWQLIKTHLTALERLIGSPDVVFGWILRFWRKSSGRCMPAGRAGTPQVRKRHLP